MKPRRSISEDHDRDARAAVGPRARRGIDDAERRDRRDRREHSRPRPEHPSEDRGLEQEAQRCRSAGCPRLPDAEDQQPLGEEGAGQRQDESARALSPPAARLRLRVRGAASRGRARGHAPRLVVRDEHAPRLRALVAGDHPAALEHVDQPARPRVADAQPTLQQRHRGRLVLGDAEDRLVEQRVLVRVELLRLDVGRVGEQLLVELGLGLPAALLDDQRDLLLGDEGALDALQSRGARAAGRACRPSRAAPRRRRCRG